MATQTFSGTYETSGEDYRSSLQAIGEGPAGPCVDARTLASILGGQEALDLKVTIADITIGTTLDDVGVAIVDGSEIDIKCGLTPVFALIWIEDGAASLWYVKLAGMPGAYAQKYDENTNAWARTNNVMTFNGTVLEIPNAISVAAKRHYIMVFGA